MILGILLLVLALIAGYLAYALFRDPHYVVSRKLVIKASPEKIFPHLNNFLLMNAWNPFLASDPKVTITVSGPAEGVGAKTSWAGGPKVGAGSAVVVESVPNERVLSHLVFLKPFRGEQECEFRLAAAPLGTTVTWEARGKNGFPGRIICGFMNMDKMTGGLFEKGLEALRAKTES